MCNKRLVIVISVVLAFPIFGTSQTSTNANDSSAAKTIVALAPKPYEQVITKDAITDQGLFAVHKVKDRYFFEIADSLVGRDILLVNRISKVSSNSLQSMIGYSGDQISQRIVRFERGPNYRIFLKELNVIDFASDSSENGMYHKVSNSRLLPILFSFVIKAYNQDSSGVVIEVTDLLAGDNGILFFANKNSYGITGSILADKSYISTVKSYPINVEITTIKTYGNDIVPQTFELNNSLVLLPNDSMKPRESDARVGYFSSRYIDFDANPHGVKSIGVITRWRMEPKEKDIAKYLRGELVEPKHPIVYYIDPATPKKWVPYLIQGVNDWQQAFEQAGFKNAIYAVEAPKDDTTWSLYDARHNAIVYKASNIPNASGPVVIDPRTGEILETHINWYHNVMQLLHDWYFVQASPNDARAREMQFPDSLMGQLIRFVSSHEVGHTLGLTHNYGASSTVPVDSLRSKTYLEQNGFCPSIMDYARFNYVAQPEDGLSPQHLFPRIGIYDKWAIEWGYRWFPPASFQSPEAERAYFSQWVTAQMKKDKRYWYGEQHFLIVRDPRRQSEDLGDDAMKAGYYGIKNLKRIVPNLIQWTKEPHKDYSGLKRMNQQVIAQYARYIGHVTSNIGLYTWNQRMADEPGNVVGFVPKEAQKKAVQFLHDHLFEAPEWLMSKEVFAKVGGRGPLLPYSLQIPILNRLISYDTHVNTLYSQGQEGKQAYSFDELLTDLEKGIWKELRGASPINFYRRQLQILYAERLLEVLNPATSSQAIESGIFAYFQIRSDIQAIVRSHAKSIITNITKALPHYKDTLTREHLLNIKEKLQREIRKNRIVSNAGTNSGNMNAFDKAFQQMFEQPANSSIGINHLKCWERIGD